MEGLFDTVVLVSLPPVDGMVVVSSSHSKEAPPGTQLETCVPLEKVQFMKTVMEETDLQLMDSAVNRHHENHDSFFLTTFRYILSSGGHTDIISDITDHIARLSWLKSDASRVILRGVMRDSIQTPAILERTVASH